MLKTSADITFLFISGLATSGTTAVGLAGVMDTNRGILNEETLIPFGLFLGGLAMTATVVWKVAGHKAKTDIKLNDLLRRIERIEEDNKRKESK
jgi:hypothetical protein